ncbi:hypothetical protein P7C73_g1866, partial [Tremellales sp. Uapishka_1]
MTTPPSSLPSPVPSSSSSHQPRSFSSLSHLQTTPAPPLQPNGQLDAHPFLPPVTASPPTHPPPYIPPPQHAMPPDPIHSMPMSGMGMLPPPPPGSYGQWRPMPASYSGGGPYRPMPNGHGPDGLANGYGSRPLSAGDGREKRRGREDGEEEEVISTIFVVGFPDDMQEREFQNIFTFSPGFEAATLKFPSSSVRREPTAALLAELQQLAAAQGGGEEGQQQQLEEALAALQMGGGTQSTSSSTTPSAAMSLTPSAPSGPMMGNSGMPTRRQTIGFARFKTRVDALAAREHLQGRKIDSLTGATLKAEMAKKNLHTKRGIGGEELVGLLLRSGRLAGLMGQQPINGSNLAGLGALLQAQQQQQQPPQHPIPPHPSLQGREAWESWSAAPNHQAQGTPPHYQSAPAQFGERLQDDSKPSLALSSSLPASYPSQSYPLSSSYPNQQIPSSLSNASGSPPNSVTSPNQRPTDSKALLALAEEADELEGWSVGGAVWGSQKPPSSNNPTPSNSMNPHMQGLGMGGMYRGQGDNFGTSPPVGGGLGDGGSDRGGLGTVNPADQNPPINTLYIGNLPAISPPTHPPNFLEESLRSLFQRCHGFKRMSFRQKINGPMCFVEFEDVQTASMAIKDLYGHNLGGLVKGGIRLSYSKNSLGQRGTSYPSGISTSMFGGIAHTVALAGMSSPNNSTGPSQYQIQGQHPHPSSVPIPMASQRGYENQQGALSPTAQPFNLASQQAQATSPRSRYFQQQSQPPQPLPNQNPNANQNQGQFSPMSSPIRTPASLSWLSSSGPSGGMQQAQQGYGFDPFANQIGSLNGAASAWGQGGHNSQH